MGFISKVKSKLQFAGYGAYARVFETKTVRHNGVKFSLGTSTANEVHRGFTFSTKEPETLAWIDSFPIGDLVFYDIGANIGIYALYAEQRHPGADIYAFEPDSQSFAALCQNAFRNRWNTMGSHIKPYQFAMAAKSYIGTLNISRLYAAAGAAALDAEYQFVHTKPRDIFKQGVAAFSLDDLVGAHGFPQPNFVKIDVDGLEEQILSGATNVLRSKDLRGLLVEFQYRQESDLAPVIDRLAAVGLHLKMKSQWVAEFEGAYSRNFIFGR